MIGRFLAGFSVGAAFSLVPLFVTEISQDSVRGLLGFFFVLSCSSGMMLMFLAGNIFDYSTTPRVAILLPIAFIASFSFLPETPIFLLRQNKFREAEESLKFFRCISKGEKLSESEKIEIEKMKKKIEEDETKKRRSILYELGKKIFEV
jgi:MFS family permease